MKATIVIPRMAGLEPPTEKIPDAPFQRDQAIESAVDAYLDAKQILANAESVLASARKELEAQLKNRVAVETEKYKIWWNVQHIKGFWMNPRTQRPLRIFSKGEANAKPDL